MERRGLVVGIRDMDGRMRYGEAAPLEGLHTGFEQTRQQLLDHLIGGKDPGYLSAICRCALEMARAKEQQGGAIRVNALIGPSSTEQEIDAASGFGTVKIKVGRGPLDEDIARIRKLRRRLGPGIAFRLDANRAWSPEQTLRFHREIGDPRLDYIEEPLRDPSRLGRLRGIPIALDESLAENSSLIGLPGLRAIVLKPTVSGGIGGTMSTMRDAASRGIKAVVSSTFESSIGLAALGRLALKAPGTVHGLGTAAWLAGDLLAPPLLPVGERLEIPPADAIEGRLISGRLKLELAG
jgi:o-succinylbenzoate synthase